MADLEGDQVRRESEAVSPWIPALIWTLTAIAVSWCWYAPCMTRWLPAVVATVSCVVAMARLLMSADAVRFLLTTTVLVGLKGLALGIERLLRY
jgi:O-antigen ligase